MFKSYSTHTFVPSTQPQAMRHIPPATHKTTQQMHSKFVDDWRNQMSQECNIASTNSSPRKRKDMEGHDNKCPLTAVLERRSCID